MFLAGFAKRFGLKPEHFAANVRDNYQRHEVDQESVDPYKLAGEYCNELVSINMNPITYYVYLIIFNYLQTIKNP